MKGMDVCDNQPGMNVCGNRSTKRRNAYMVALSWCSWRRVPRRSKNVLLAGSIALFPCHKRSQEIYNCIRPANQIRNNRCNKNEYIDGMTGRTSSRTPEGRPSGMNAWLSASDIDQIIYDAVNHDESLYDRRQISSPYHWWIPSQG